jgi:hypothetical protein
MIAFAIKLEASSSSLQLPIVCALMQSDKHVI